jgi:hypothetical protein
MSARARVRARRRRSAQGVVGAPRQCRLSMLCVAAISGRPRLPPDEESRNVKRGMEGSYQRAQTTSTRPRRWLLGGLSVLWLCLCGESPEGHAAPRAPHVDAADGCRIEQKKPLFVGFAAGMTLDAFEPAAQASRAIWLTTKALLCTAPAPAPHALTQALSQHATLRGEAVHFEDQQFERAHVVMVDARQAHPHSGWHVHLVRGETTWRVTHATDVVLALGAQRP